jgi:hypothetical protein
MEWPLASSPVKLKEIPFYNLHYLFACGNPADPNMVWGTDVEAEGLESYLKLRNAGSKSLVTVGHVLVQAVGRALARFPQLNRRVVGRRIYSFRETNVRMMAYNKKRGEVEVVLIRNADRLGLERIARTLWKYQYHSLKDTSPDHVDKEALRWWPAPVLRWMIGTYLWLDRHFRLPKVGRIDRISNAPVLVNYLAFSGAPPMRAYKPSHFPDESSHLNVTMGRIEPRPVVRGQTVVVRRLAPLFVRADHRLADPYLLGQFLNTLCTFLADPAQMEPQDAGENGAPAVPLAA